MVLRRAAWPVTACACCRVAVDRRVVCLVSHERKLGGGNGDGRIDNLTSVAGGEGILDSHAVAVAETDSESGALARKARGKKGKKKKG